MRFTHLRLFAICSVLLFAVFAVAATPEAVFSKRGKLLFSDDFSTVAPAPGWAGKVGNWEVANGTAKVSERPEDKHGAVRRYALDHHDAISEFSFRFDGASRIALVLDEKGAHVAILFITPKGMTLQTGKLANTNDKSQELASLEVPIEGGKWHKAKLEVRGKRLTAQIDGNPPITGESERVDVDKKFVVFLVEGVSAELDNVQVHEVR